MAALINRNDRDAAAVMLGRCAAGLREVRTAIRCAAIPARSPQRRHPGERDREEWTMTIRRFLAGLLLAWPALSPLAGAGVEPGHLAGKWSADGRDGCTADGGRYVLFRANGTLEGGRGTAPVAVGFWKGGKDIIRVKILSSPEYPPDYNVLVQLLKPAVVTKEPVESLRDYEYSQFSIHVIESRPDALDIIAGTALGLQRETLTRCPQD
jgi:hypothetical protein